jgi:uncharacterized protein RhaS with RHS repeats
VDHVTERNTRIETIFYDADGNITTDRGLAVRGEAVEVDASGNVIRSLREVGEPRARVQRKRQRATK